MFKFEDHIHIKFVYDKSLNKYYYKICFEIGSGIDVVLLKFENFIKIPQFTLSKLIFRMLVFSFIFFVFLFLLFLL